MGTKKSSSTYHITHTVPVIYNNMFVSPIYLMVYNHRKGQFFCYFPVLVYKNVGYYCIPNTPKGVEKELDFLYYLVVLTAHEFHFCLSVSYISHGIGR